MKRNLIVIATALGFCATATVQAKGNSHSSNGSHSVSGHVTKSGTYVAPHHATNPNGSKSDNWSQKGNVNPYTGKEGTKQ